MHEVLVHMVTCFAYTKYSSLPDKTLLLTKKCRTKNGHTCSNFVLLMCILMNVYVNVYRAREVQKEIEKRERAVSMPQV